MINVESLVSKTYFYEIHSENLKLFNEVVCFPLNAIKKNDPTLVPPTYATLFRKGEFELLDTMGIQLSQLLHGEQTYEYHLPMNVGQKIKCVSKVKSKIVKKSGKLTVLVFSTEVLDENSNDLYVQCESTLLVRG